MDPQELLPGTLLAAGRHGAARRAFVVAVMVVDLGKEIDWSLEMVDRHRLTGTTGSHTSGREIQATLASQQLPFISKKSTHTIDKSVKN